MAQTFTLTTARDTLTFDSESGKLLALRTREAPETELLAAPDRHPVFVLQYLDADHAFRELSSDQAAEVRVGQHTHADGSAHVTMRFRRVGGLAIDAEVTVRASAEDRFTRWSISVRNDTDVRLTLVQFPFIVLRFGLGGEQGRDQLLWPLEAGQLRVAPRPQDLTPDWPQAWQMIPANGDANHYPGLTFAQFLAYAGDAVGVYAACEDASGAVKLIRPVHREPGLRLGFAHVGDWPQRGERALGYDVVVGTFEGDWYAAADLYRAWALQQPWARLPLTERTDVPAWLLESPPHIILRMQGELDAGPTGPNEQFLPYTKTLPLLDTLSERIGAPLVPVIMSWERPGPWIYPDCFPPAGGSDSLRAFTEEARKRGWPVGSFCNGTRWVTGHSWSGYDGEEYYRREGGDQSVCRTHDGEPWRETWDASWRPSFACCAGAERTRDVALGFVQTLLDLGLDWVQFFDQNVGACTFPCYSDDHGHPAAPGRWMTETMRSLIAEMASRGRAAGGDRQVALSVECPMNEHFLQDFQLCDVRVHPTGYGGTWVPLFHYLYHEFVVIQGGFGLAPEPYHLQIRNAYNLVVGEIPGAVMAGDGHLLNADTINWAPWEPPIGDNNASVAVLRSTAALRRGPAREWLVFGRMQRPPRVAEAQTVRWESHQRVHEVPAVFHAAWTAPDGRSAVVLANWTTDEQAVRLVDERIGENVRVAISAEHVSSGAARKGSDGLVLTLPPFSCALVEAMGT